MKAFPYTKTKETYRAFLEESIVLFASLAQETGEYIMYVIGDQLQDIKENVVMKGIYSGFYEVNTRYSIGTIALRYFTEGDVFQERLLLLFDGATDYDDYPEKMRMVLTL